MLFDEIVENRCMKWLNLIKRKLVQQLWMLRCFIFRGMKALKCAASGWWQIKCEQFLLFSCFYCVAVSFIALPCAIQFSRVPFVRLFHFQCSIKIGYKICFIWCCDNKGNYFHRWWNMILRVICFGTFDALNECMDRWCWKLLLNIPLFQIRMN